MSFQEVYIGMGGNIGDTLSIFDSVIKDLERQQGIFNVKSSKFYITPPISDIIQPNFINAVCKFSSYINPLDLFEILQDIEKKHGKLAKAKNAPRRIDLDILFYGKKVYQTPELEIPHPQSLKRLFVLIPLLELTKKIEVSDQIIDLERILQKFTKNEIDSIKRVDTRES